jgi:hypothetical protein
MGSWEQKGHRLTDKKSPTQSPNDPGSVIAGYLLLRILGADYGQTAMSRGTKSPFSMKFGQCLSVRLIPLCLWSVQAWPLRELLGTTGGQVYASVNSGGTWQAIVRDLPAVLSVEVQTLS